MKKSFPKNFEEMSDDELQFLLKKEKNVSEQEKYKIKLEIRLREKLENITNYSPEVENTAKPEVLSEGEKQLDSELQKIKDKTVYRSIAYIGSLIILITFLVHIENETGQVILDFLSDFVVIIVFTTAFLWIRKRILMISLIVYMLYWNLDILNNPLIQSTNNIFSGIYNDIVGLVLNIISVLGLILGLINKFKLRYLTEEIEVNANKTIGLLIWASIIFQLIIRII